MSQPPSERLSGAIERVTFHSPESGFCVLRVKVRGERELITVIGSAASLTPGESLEAEGGWINDRQHGLPFKASDLRVIPPRTLDGIEKYLGSGMVKGIGPHFARKLVSAFGEAVFDIIEQTPARLLELEGIGPKRQQRVTRAWAEQKVIRAIMVFLQSHGAGTARAVRIYKIDGDEAVERVRENPDRPPPPRASWSMPIVSTPGRCPRIRIPSDPTATSSSSAAIPPRRSMRGCCAW